MEKDTVHELDFQGKMSSYYNIDLCISFVYNSQRKTHQITQIRHLSHKNDNTQQLRYFYVYFEL